MLLDRTYLFYDCITTGHFRTELSDNHFLVVPVLINIIAVIAHSSVFIFYTLLYVPQHLLENTQDNLIRNNTKFKTITWSVTFF